MYEFLGLAGRGGNSSDVPVSFDRKAGYRFTGRGNTVDNLLRPPGLDTDDDAGRNVRVGAGADHRTEVKFEVLAELQPSVGMRQGDRSSNMGGDRLARSVGNIVERQNHDVIAYTHSTVLAAVAPNRLLRV